MPLGSAAAGHGHDQASVSVLRSKNVSMLNFKFGLTMSWYLSSDRNFLLLLKCLSLRPFQRRLAQLAAIICSIVICLSNF